MGRRRDKGTDLTVMQSISQFFSYMNDVDFPYVVIRNWHNLPHSVELGDHSDLDLLVYDLAHWREIFPEARPEYPSPRVRFKMPIGDSYIFIDVRHVGDSYFPLHFQQAMLQTREWNENGFYTPDQMHFRLGLAYHVAHHKNHNKYQRWLGDVSVTELLEALKKSHVGWVEPDDPTVGDFNPYWKGATSVVSKEDGAVVKKQTGWTGYNLVDNEYRILSQVESWHFPKVLNKDPLTIEDCGDPLTVDNLPKDWSCQLGIILAELKRHKIEHRDIKPDNLMVKDDVIKLIDFGWARFEGDPKDNPPTCLGFPYRPSWGPDDKFAMNKVIKQFEYKLEPVCEFAV